MAISQFCHKGMFAVFAVAALSANACSSSDSSPDGGSSGTASGTSGTPNDGATGTSGTSGTATGASGSSGTATGASGSGDASTGATGSSGTATGGSGTSGTATGAAGTTGSAGTSGTSGSLDGGPHDAMANNSTPDATMDGSTHDAMVDSSTPDAADGGDGSMTEGMDGSTGCISAIYGEYTVRTNGTAVLEAVTSETVVVDNASGPAATPLANVVSIQQQLYAACALLSGGTVSCWQEDAANGNVDGQLGDGNTNAIAVYRAVPVLTAANTPLTNVVSLASGYYTDAACAVTGDGKLWCWGNLSWLVDNGTQDYAPFAQAITQDGQTPLTGVIQAAVGVAQACALVQGSPNTVWCWGNASGESLGQGNSTNHPYPVQVPQLTNPSKVVFTNVYDNAGGPDDAVCVIDEQAVECWGGGHPNGTAVPAPTLVDTNASPAAPLRDVQDLQEGLGGFGAMVSGGTIWTWGAPQGAAAAYGVTNVVQLGWAGGGSIGIRYLTSDGVYHNQMSKVTIDCTL
jgi:hypothetical protein